jgi:epoxyqueuosine reductase
MNPLELAGLFDMPEADFRRRFRHTPLWRPHRRGLLRNAAIVLGNQRAAGAIEALERGLNDVEPVVRGACAWALGQIGTDAAHDCLRRRARVEQEAEVCSEINAALAVALT